MVVGVITVEEALISPNLTSPPKHDLRDSPVKKGSTSVKTWIPERYSKDHHLILGPGKPKRMNGTCTKLRAGWVSVSAISKAYRLVPTSTRLHPADERHNNKQSKKSNSSPGCRSRRLNRGLGRFSKKVHHIEPEKKNGGICTSRGRFGAQPYTRGPVVHDRIHAESSECPERSMPSWGSNCLFRV